jgi:predicted transcriptional regulator
MSTVTVRLDKKLDSQLNRIAKKTGRPKSDLIREALRRQLSVMRFDEMRRSVAPFAEARGWLTDEDVFRDIS